MRSIKKRSYLVVAVGILDERQLRILLPDLRLLLVIVHVIFRLLAPYTEKKRPPS